MKGKRYIDTPAKYYFEDVGLRNARLNFRQQEEDMKAQVDENGIIMMGIYEFLLDENSLNY